MIYGEDSPIALPVIDLYDTGIMKMYVDAAKEQYQLGLKDYETFMSLYGDFTSPFKKDVDWWDKNVMGPVINKINEYYAMGIDPTREPHARAEIARLTRSVPRTLAANAKANAARGEAYLKELGKLAALGKYDLDQNNFYLQLMGYPLFSEFSTEKNGVWGLESPVEASSLYDNTYKWFDNMEAGEMTPAQVNKMMGPGYAKPGYTYTGIPEERLYEIIEEKIPGWLDTLLGKFFVENAKQRAKAELGDKYTPEEAMKMLKKDIVTANKERLRYPKGELDKEAELNIRYRLEMAKQAAADRAALNRIRLTALLKNGGDEDSDYGSGSGSGSGSKKKGKGHSHLFEIYTQGITQNTGPSGLDVIENPKGAAMNMLRNQQNLFQPGGTSIKKDKNGQRTIRSIEVLGKTYDNKSAMAALEHMSGYDAPGTIVKFFVNKKPNENNTISLDNNDKERLFSSAGIVSNSYGCKWKPNKNPLTTNAGYRYAMQPTGRYVTLYEKDGRIRTYAQMNIYQLKKPTDDGRTYDATLYTKGWYDMHVTSTKQQLPKRKYRVNKDKMWGEIIVGNTVYTGFPLQRKRIKDPDNPRSWKYSDEFELDRMYIPDVGYFPEEQLDVFSLTSSYDTENESTDVNMGRSMGDTSSANTSEARIK